MKFYRALALCILLPLNIFADIPFPKDQSVIFTPNQAADLIKSVCYAAPKELSGYWTPQEYDLDGIEHALSVFFESKRPEAKVDYSQYRRQIVGVKRNKNFLLFINYFHFDIKEEQTFKGNRRIIDQWKTKPYIASDGGNYFFRILYDIKTKSIIWYECNGEA